MQLSDRIGRRMKLQDLHVLMTVVQAGSMGKAAERLNTSQPNISRSISELEHTLGVRLLDRHSQGIEPTEYGRALLDCGLTVFDGLRQGVKNIEHLADPTTGEVKVGSIIPLAAGFVANVVDRLSQRYPRMTFHIAATEAEALHRELCERNVDLVIIKRIGPFMDEQFSVETLFNDSYVVVVGAQHPLARRRKVELTELANQSWVLPAPDTAPGAALMEAFRANGLRYPRVNVVTLPTEVRATLLATGRFLSIFPATSLGILEERMKFKVLPVEMPFAPVPVTIVTLKNRTLSPAAQLFIDAARDLAKSFGRRKQARSS
jgi:DNA-binding transcriptional LysR family regulator